jgi:hypothetical protein
MRLRSNKERVRDRFGLLLALLVGSFLVLGFAADAWARVVASTLQLAAVLVAFVATRLRLDHRLLAPLGILGLVVVVLETTTGDVTSGLAAIGAAILLVVLLVAVLDRVLRHRTVTLQTIFGAMCAYFLIGLAFSSAYAAMNAFSSEPVFGESVNESVYSYFSFVTLTTVGFGDYTAVTDFARRVVAIEAVAGQLFIATTLARLVSLYRSPSTSEET